MNIGEFGGFLFLVAAGSVVLMVGLWLLSEGK